MQTYRCPTTKDTASRKPAAEVSSVFMDQLFSFKAYSMAHDGRSFFVHMPDGVELHRQGKAKLELKMHLPFNPRDFLWHPDSKRVAFWCMHTPKKERVGQIVSPRRSIAVMDVSKLGASAPSPIESAYEVVYSTHPEHTPFGLEWSPKGDALFVVERGTDPVDRSAFGMITRIDLSNVGQPKEIVRMPGDIDFFMPPVSRFERGEGASPSDFQLVFGHIEGLYVVDPEGRKAQQLSDLPAVGLYNIEWNPNPRKNEVTLFFRRPVHGKGGRTFVGVYLVRVDKLLQRRAAAPATNAPQPEAGGAPAAPTGPEPIEQLYDGLDIHTLWYSPRGTYVTWASPWGLWYRRPDDPPSKAVQVLVPAQDGAQLEIKGCTWSDDERKLAFTAGNKLFICELPANEVYEVYSIGNDTTHFLADPRFIGDEVFVSSYEDAQATGRVTNKIQFGMPGAPKDVTQGRGRIPDSPEKLQGMEPAPPPPPTAPGQGNKPRKDR